MHLINPPLDRFYSFLATLTSLRYLVESHFWLFPHLLASLSEPGFSCVPPNIKRSAYKDKQQSMLESYLLLKHILKSEENYYIIFYGFTYYPIVMVLEEMTCQPGDARVSLRNHMPINV